VAAPAGRGRERQNRACGVMRRGPRVLAVLILGALLAAGCGKTLDARPGADADTGPGTATSATATVAATPATTTTTTTAPAAPTALDQALWPAPEQARAKSTPRGVVHAFVEKFVGMENPVIGEFEEGEPRAGEVPVLRRGEDGLATDRVVAIVAVRKLDGKRWFVTAALSDEIDLESPEVLDEIASPVRVQGQGVAHEGNIVVSLHKAFRRKPLARQSVIAGATKRVGFSANLAFERPSVSAGAILVRTGAPLGRADTFAAFPVRFAGGS